MIRAAVTVILACLIIAVDAAPAKRVGLIRVFAVTEKEITTPGHRFVIKAIRDRRRGKRIGEIVQACDLLPDGRQACTAQINMPLGRLIYTGTRRSARYYVMAVVGGTGIYAGSSGQLAATTITPDPRVEYILVSLVP